MIASLEGTVLMISEDNLVVGVGGIGMRVYVPRAVTGAARPGERLHLFTHLVVREDSLTLFGFETQEECNFFDLLLGVNGIGPRTALSVLSTLSVDAVRRAVLSEQADLFARVPGVGKKTGQKIILYLQGKVGTSELAGMPVLDIDTEVMDALTALGYSVVEAQAALQSIPRDAPKDVESRLRLALQYFST
jgi:holliday junction DNA helicase RuvA